MSQHSCVLNPFSGKIAARKLSDVDEEDEEDESHLDLEDEVGGEKENELLCNEGEATASKPKKQGKRKTEKDASTEEPNNKKNKTVEKGTEQGKGALSYFKEFILIVSNLVDLNDVGMFVQTLQE